MYRCSLSSRARSAAARARRRPRSSAARGAGGGERLTRAARPGRWRRTRGRARRAARRRCAWRRTWRGCLRRASPSRAPWSPRSSYRSRSSSSWQGAVRSRRRGGDSDSGVLAHACTRAVPRGAAPHPACRERRCGDAPARWLQARPALAAQRTIAATRQRLSSFTATCDSHYTRSTFEGCGAVPWHHPFPLSFGCRER